LFVANSYWTNALNDCLYRNNGDGPFTKMTTNQVGMLVGDGLKTMPCAWRDYDNDGWPDLWVGTIYTGTGEQFLWHNDRNGTFTRVLAGSLALTNAMFMSIWGDYDNDGFSDTFLTTFGGGTTSLNRNLGGLTFDDVAQSAGVAETMEGGGAAWGDYDNDGFLDLIAVGYGHAWARGGWTFVYHNNGDGTFTSVDVGSPNRDGDHRDGCPWVDYDNDGFLDLFITCGDGGLTTNNLLYRNNGNGNGWLKVKPIGTASNRSAIGAKVRVTATIRGQTISQMREISGNSGIGGRGDGLLAHFGLGDATNVDVVRIEWPSGLVQEFANVPVKQTLTVTEHQAGVTNAPSLTATRSTEGAVQLTLTGQPNLLYVFEGSTNLVQWTKLGVRTNLTGTVEFTDTWATKYAQRFYRGVAP